MSDERDYQWLDELVEQVGAWSEANFGEEQGPELPLIGAGEELGELTTSVLKREQGIDDSEKYEDRVGDIPEQDAIGDIVIYLLDAVHRCDSDVDVTKKLGTPFADGMWDFVDDPVEMVRALYTEYGAMVEADWTTSSEYSDHERVEMQVNYFLIGLQRFCEIRGFDFKSAVLYAWEDVSGRKWDADVNYDR